MERNISSSLSKEDKSFYNRLNTICKVTKSNFIKFAKDKYDYIITNELNTTALN